MSTESAYDISTMTGGVDHELERLRDQVMLSWAKESRNLKWWGLQDGMSVLDVGSGPGFVTGELLDMLPSSHVTGLELDPVMVEKAEKYLAAHAGGRWHIVRGSVMDSGLEAESFDFAIARYLFQHLPNPVGAAREVLRVLKPGGKLVICDIDEALHIWVPEDPPEIKALGERFKEEHASKGGDRNVGRKLLRILKQAGFHNCTIESLVVHTDEVGLDRLSPQIGPEFYKLDLEEGKISQREFDLLMQLDHELHGPNGMIMLTILMVCGEK